MANKKQTSRRVGKIASAVLRKKRAGKKEKSLAGSALVQVRKP